ncbi:MAG: hypothetical protein HY080_04590 [Gammaproteobacteria bacterium]|nr:hypothetical protein [Gammaproteobacteria bacterium]
MVDRGNDRIRKIVIATASVTTLAGGVYGAADGTSSAAQFLLPNDITTDGTNLYVSDSGNINIRQIVIATGVVTTLAGGASGIADGTGSAAQFGYPYGITTNGKNLYMTDSGNYTIRKIQ